MTRLICLFFSLLLSGCMHLNQEQCLSTDWATVGANDGMNGKPPRDLTSAILDCAKFNIKVNTNYYLKGWHDGMKTYCTPSQNLGFMDGSAGKNGSEITSRSTLCASANLPLNLHAYTAGRLQGLKTYCTFDNAFAIARQGQGLPDVCPQSLNKNFTSGWNKGRDTLCNDTGNAFSLGKNGSSYPGICTALIYPGFKGEYDRGQLIGSRSSFLRQKIAEVSRITEHNTFQYNLNFNGQNYALGVNQSPEAINAMDQNNNLVLQKQGLERELFEIQVLR
jgi:hypothetical protein